MKDKILAMLAAKDTGKAAYAEADRLLDEILTAMKVGEQVQLGEGQVAEVIDNFAVKNKSWKPCGISRFDIKVSRGSFKAQSPDYPPSPQAARGALQNRIYNNAVVDKVEKTLPKKKSPKPSALALRIRAHEQDASKTKPKHVSG